MLKDIMVHLDQATSCPGRLAAAVTLAKQHDASLTGLYVYTSPRQKEPARQLSEVRAMFQQQTAAAGLGVEFVDVDLGYSRTGVAEMIGYYASFTDLLVVSQPLTTEKDKQHAMITSPERLLIGTGRPVLIVPGNSSLPRLGERVMVAWKAGPKASRALHDAMPLLQKAKHVSMVSIDNKPFHASENERLSRYLAKHGVTATVEMIPPGDLRVGDTLLNLVADDNIDLMILGVHITTKRAHLDMGVVASYLLTQMTVPMLLSH